MKLALLLCLFIASIEAIAFYAVTPDAEWETFKAMYGKHYSGLEDTFRRKIFMENKMRVFEHNKLYTQGIKTYELAINEFADLLHTEFKSLMLGLSKPYRTNRNFSSTYLSPANVYVPKLVDWRKEGYVTPVKNQGSCGSCWAFSTTGSLEGQHFKKSGKLVSLSEQNLVDCSQKYDNHGCSGGLMDNAFKYIKDNGGIDTELSYPYEGEDDTCRFKKGSVGATVSGFVDVPEGNETALQEALATVGPISVAIDASHQSFQLYSHGIYYEPECSSTELDHGVLTIGYGTNKKGLDYWLVKNSWGESWGQKGYVKMARNKKNNCGIATVASYPLV